MYSAMNRVYKHYAIKVAASGQKAMPATEVMSFSSYPGYLSSLDDFLIMDRYCRIHIMVFTLSSETTKSCIHFAPVGPENQVNILLKIHPRLQK